MIYAKDCAYKEIIGVSTAFATDGYWDTYHTNT